MTVIKERMSFVELKWSGQIDCSTVVSTVDEDLQPIRLQIIDITRSEG